MYGRYYLGNGKSIDAHREAYKDAHGPIPQGMLVRHTCDVGLCVNPYHLILGTTADNMRDKMERGRHHGNHKLTAEQVDEIRSLRGKEVARIVGLRYGVGRSTISMLWSGHTWKPR